MKKESIYLILFLFLGVLIISITSCDLEGITIDARIDSFISDLNNDRYNAYTNFDSTETEDYDSLKDPVTTLDQIFPTSGIPYSRGAIVTIDSDTVTTVLDDIGTWGPKDARFEMNKVGSTWYINDLYLDNVLVIK